MNLREAAKQAMIATPHKQLIDELLDSRIPKSEREHAAAREIERLRQELVKPEQEPVATVESVATVVSESGNQEITMSWWHEPALPVGTKLYAAPPKREPLTDEEIESLADEFLDWNLAGIESFARAIERAHGIGGEE